MSHPRTTNSLPAVHTKTYSSSPRPTIRSDTCGPQSANPDSIKLHQILVFPHLMQQIYEAPKRRLVLFPQGNHQLPDPLPEPIAPLPRRSNKIAENQ